MEFMANNYFIRECDIGKLSHRAKIFQEHNSELIVNSVYECVYPRATYFTNSGIPYIKDEIYEYSSVVFVSIKKHASN